MAAQTFYFKEHEGLEQLSSVLPWLGAFGSQQGYGESYGHSKPFNMELPNSGHHLTATKQHERGIEQGLDKGNTNQFTIFPGDAQKSEAAISLQSSQPKYRGHFELGFSQPMICAKYPYMDQCYGLFSSYGPQVSGRIMLPLSLTTDEGPIYVNAKQYHGIIRRRQSRSKAFMENRAARLRKPYMHESRHLHAMRRPRGCGGRFLNTKTSNNGKSGNKMKQVGDVELFRHSGSQSSEVLQSESGTLNSSKETNGSSSNISSSEVTSTYSRQWITAATSKFDSKRKMGLVLTHCINPIVSATKWRTFVAVTVIVIAAGFGSQVCTTTIWLLSKATHSWLMCRRGVSFDSKQSAVRLASENPEAT